MPSGQWCRIRRLDRIDLFKLKILDHLDNLLPQLIDIGDDDQKAAKIQDALKKNMDLVDDMYTVIDIIVMACSVRPLVTDDKTKVNYGTEADWANPEFTAVVHLDDIELEDRQLIFGSAFAGDAEALKSVPQPAGSLGDVPAVSGVQLPTEPTS
jgi:hypothetical protein